MYLSRLVTTSSRSSRLSGRKSIIKSHMYFPAFSLGKYAQNSFCKGFLKPLSRKNNAYFLTSFLGEAWPLFGATVCTQKSKNFFTEAPSTAINAQGVLAPWLLANGYWLTWSALKLGMGSHVDFPCLWLVLFNEEVSTAAKPKCQPHHTHNRSFVKRHMGQ